MPKVRPLTQKQREAQAIEQEVQRACQMLLIALGEKRGRENKTYIEMAETLGISRVTLRSWRDGKLPGAHFGQVIAAYAKLGYRLVPEPIAGKPKNPQALEWGDQPILNRGA